MSENGKKKLIYGFIGFGCGIALSGIMMLVVVLNTNEYQQGLITYISSSDEQKEDKGQINTTQPSSSEKDPVSESEIIGDIILEDNDSDKGAIQEPVVIEDNQKEPEPILVYIPKNSPSAKICEILQENGVILDAKDFEEYIKMNKKTKQLRSGEILVSSELSYEELLKYLVNR